MANSSSYKAVRAEFHHLVTAISPNVADIARKAFAKNLISLPNMEEAENMMLHADTRTSKLLVQILKKIEEDTNHFKTFLSILESEPVLEGLARRLKEDENKSITCPGCKSPLACPNQFPYLNTEELDTGSRINLEAKLLSDTQEMILKFKNLLQTTRKSLEERNISPKTVAITALSVSAMGPGAVREPILKEHENMLLRAKSIPQILLILTPYMSFFNHEILKEIICDLGTEQDKKNLTQYLSDFDHFCKRSVFEVPPTVYAQASDNPENRKMFAVKLAKTQETDVTLIHVLSVRARIAEVIGLDPASLYLCHIEAGCVELTFMIPPYMVHKVFPLNSTKIEWLKELGISVVTDPLKTKFNTNSTSAESKAMSQSYDKPKSQSDLASKRSAMAEPNQFPYLDVKELDAISRANLEARLLSDTQEMILKFKNLIQTTSKSLEERKIAPDKVAMTALNVSAMGPKAVCEPVLKKHEDVLLCAQSISKILVILTPYMSFFNHEILKEIISDHGSEQDKKNLTEFQSDFHHFCKRSVFEVPPTVYAQATDNPENRKMFAVKLVDAQEKSITLTHIVSARERIAEVIGLDPASLYLCHIAKGCVELTFMIPPYVVDKVFPLNATKIALLKDLGISVITGPDVSQAAVPSKTPQASNGKTPSQLPKENPATTATSRASIDTHSLLDYEPYQLLVY